MHSAKDDKLCVKRDKDGVWCVRPKALGERYCSVHDIEAVEDQRFVEQCLSKVSSASQSKGRVEEKVDSPGVVAVSTQVEDLRFPLRIFVREMERVLQTHDEEKGTRGWRMARTAYLLASLDREVAELRLAIVGGNGPAIAHEAVDVANMALMLYDKVRQTDYGDEEIRDKIKEDQDGPQTRDPSP